MKITILLPLYNDWISLNKLLGKNFFFKNKKKFNIIIINDNSYIKKKSIEYLKNFNKVIIINLKSNLGSQRAIIVGLSYLKKVNTKKVIIMDSDGEDNPALISKILNMSNKNPEKIIVVNRSKRKENFLLRILYFIHVYFLFFTTGKTIRFGNFSLLNKNHILELINTHHSWLAYPSAVVQKFKKNILHIYAPKEKRYTGNSNMNYFNLFIHCLRMHSVFKNNAIFNLTFYNFVIYFFFSNNFFVFFFILSIIYISILNIIFYLSKSQMPKNYLKEIKKIDLIRK